MKETHYILLRLKALVFIPMTVLFAIFMFFVSDSYTKIESLDKTKHAIDEMVIASKLIYTLQEERGLSSGYITSKHVKFKNELQDKKKEVDKNLKRYRIDPKEEKLFQKTRRKIEKSDILASQSFDNFTSIISYILEKNLKHIYQIKSLEGNDRLIAYTNMVYMEELLGEMRGSLNGIFSNKLLNKKLLYKAIVAKVAFDIYLKHLKSTKCYEISNIKQKFLLTDSYKKMMRIVKKYINLNYKKHLISQNSDEWFNLSSKVINKLKVIQTNNLKVIKQYSDKEIFQKKQKIFLGVLVFIILFMFSLMLGNKLKNNILRHIALFQEYKDAIDRSIIVSKTDIKGKITYVNDEFCKISGYTRKELLGKNHNIVRHPDMPKSVFKNLWHTILAKKPWQGIIKNKKKDGGYYIVKTTINPILNDHEEIEEFIAIRVDLTKMVKAREELEEIQKNLIFQIGAIAETRSHETGLHVKRVAGYSNLLASYCGLSEKEIKYLTIASPMHDIGKVGIPDKILNKQGKLTKPEWETMKTHAKIGYDMFKNSNKPLLKAAAVMAFEHHEKYDGSGYPRGLVGKNIHIYGRITALSDVFDALGSDRCYKKAWKDEDIFALLKREKGKHFDPMLVDIFFEHLDEFLMIRSKYREDIVLL